MHHEGQVTHYQGIVEDITDRKTAEIAIRESKERGLDIMDIATQILLSKIAKVNR